MKTQTNFKPCLTKLRGQMLNLGYHSVVTQPLRCRLHHTLTMILLLLCIGVVNAWGAVTALSLPKSWNDNDGKSAYTEALGCTLSGLGSDYSSSPKLKFDGAGDYLKIQVADSPNQISFKFKQNGSNAGTFKVQESADDKTYTDALTVSWPGNGKISTQTASLKSSTRYIKLIFVTKGTSTNAAVGGISITKAADACTDITPSLSYTSTNLTIGGGNSSSPTLNKDGSSGAVTWSSDDEDVATVNSTGVVTPVGTGTCNITASIAAAGGKCAGEVSVEFTVTRTINYYIGSTAYTVGGIDGETLVSTLPASPTSCDATNYPYFVGWKNGSISGSTTTMPTILSTEVVNSTTAANTYYAVFTDKQAGYTKVTSELADWSGEYLIVNEDDGKLWRGSQTSDNNAIDVTITSGTIASSVTVDAETFTIASMTGGYSIQGSSGKYIYGTSGSNTTNYGNSAVLCTISISDGDVDITSNTSVLRQNNSTSTIFRFYKSSSYSSQHTVQLYKKGSSGTAHYITTCCTPLGQINGPIIFINVLWV